MIYDPTGQIVLQIDERETKLLGSFNFTTHSHCEDLMVFRRKRPHEPHQSWKSREKDNLALENTFPLPCQDQRGLLNLGQARFATLQALLHPCLGMSLCLGPELFAVINHEGQIGKGDYTSFARFQHTVRHFPPSFPHSSTCLFSSTTKR